MPGFSNGFLHHQPLGFPCWMVRLCKKLDFGILFCPCRHLRNVFRSAKCNPLRKLNTAQVKYVQFPMESMKAWFPGDLYHVFQAMVFPLGFSNGLAGLASPPGGRSQRDWEQQFQGQGGGSVAPGPLGEHPHLGDFDADDFTERWIAGERFLGRYHNVWNVYG